MSYDVRFGVKVEGMNGYIVFMAWNQRVGEVTINQYGEGGKVFGHVDTLTINY